jgi:spore coat assembly protein
MKQGDLVRRKSYGGDILFKIQQIHVHKAILRGVEYRLLADAPIADLEFNLNQDDMEFPRSSIPLCGHSTRQLEQLRTDQLQKYKSDPSIPMRSFFEVPGKVLHVDGDLYYLRKSMQVYAELKVPAEGFYIPESQMIHALIRLLPQVKPDILVITGHDGIMRNTSRSKLNDINNYKNSFNFVRAVQMARQYERNLDMLTIIAGACQSHFEALLQAGANFASSPARVLIHALDPLCIASKMAYTSVKDTISMLDIMDLTVTGIEGLGGLESRGSCRRGIPDMQFLL